MKVRRRVALVFGFTSLVVPAVLAACQTEATESFVVNELAPVTGAPLTIYKVWYRTTLYRDPVAPDARSETQRVGAGAEPAFALVAIAYDADAGAPRLVPARTRDVFRTEPGETTRIVFSPASTLVGCGGADGLSRDDYDLITTRIFPADAVDPFGPSGCTPAAGSADAGQDGGAQE